MTPHNQVKELLLTYPSVFVNKWRAYEFLFTSYGHGFKWKNGEVVEKGKPILKEDELTIENGIRVCTERVNDRIKNLNNISLTNGQMERETKELNRQLQEQIELIKRVEDRMIDFNPPVRSSVDINEHSLIGKIPRNITPEWRVAVNEFKSYLLDNYDSFSDITKMNVDKLKL